MISSGFSGNYTHVHITTQRHAHIYIIKKCFKLRWKHRKGMWKAFMNAHFRM